MLTILQTHFERRKFPCGQSHWFALCRCHCGNEVVVRQSGINKNSTSCGCARQETVRALATARNIARRVTDEGALLERRRKKREASARWVRENPQLVRHRRLMSEYGISLDDYNALLVAQGGRCAVCCLPERDAKRCLAVDHDHETGVVRGLLCRRCNTALGLLGESIDRVGRLQSYLQRSQ